MSFFNNYTLASGFVPVDMQTGANNGDWISLENYGKCIAVLFKAAGTAGDDPVFTLKQAKTNAGGSSKDLKFSTIYSKVGTLDAVSDFTKTAQTAAASYTDATSAEAQAIIAVEIDAGDLDVDGGFKFVQLSIPDVGTNAQIGCALYILGDCRYPQSTPPAALS